MVVNHHHPDFRKEIMRLFKDEDSHPLVYKREVNDQPDHAQPKSKSLHSSLWIWVLINMEIRLQGVSI